MPQSKTKRRRYQSQEDQDESDDFEKPKSASASKVKASETAATYRSTLAPIHITPPMILISLQKMFHKLVVVYTFSENHGVIFTLDRLKKAMTVPGDGHEISMEKLGMIKAISPQSIHLEYQCQRTLTLMKDDVDFFRIRTSPIGKSVEKESWELIISLNGSSSKKRGRKKRNETEPLNVRKPTKSSNQSAKVLALIEDRKLKFDQDFDAFVQAHSDRFCSADWVEEFTQMGVRSLPSSPSCSSASSLMEPVSSGQELVTTESAIEAMKKESFYNNQIVFTRFIPPRLPRYHEMDMPIHPMLASSLKSAQNLDLKKLYTHQYSAIRSVLSEKKHVVVASSTGSGKSMIFNIPILHSLLESRDNQESFSALYIFPTKALAQDQKQKLQKILEFCDFQDVVSTYDGDTHYDDRATIRDKSPIVITNPDMLHCSILPNHSKWAHFFKTLKYIVLDEIHVYSGLMGSHVALLMRRLFRVLKTVYGNVNVRCISCSATISNPLDHAMSIFNLSNSDIDCVTDDGSPSAGKEFIIWSPDFEASNLLSNCSNISLFFTKHGIKNVSFCKSRKGCEILATEIKKQCEQNIDLRHLSERIMPYRGGYKPEIRREIESALFNGNLSTVIATNALELGVDVGDLDVTIHIGFPSSVSSLWQQAGRAGRRKQHSIAIFIVDQDPINRFYGLVNPDSLFEKIHEHAVLNFESPSVLDQHLQCAALERAIDPLGDQEYFGEILKEAAERCLTRVNDCCFIPQRMFLPNPAMIFPIRCIESQNIIIRDLSTGVDLESVELSRALYSVYEGAVYMHQGLAYIIQYADFEQKLAGAVQTRVNYITRQRDFTDVDGVKTLMARVLTSGSPEDENEIHVHYGHVQTTYNVFGYYKYDPRKNVIIDTVDIHARPVEKQSLGVWIKLPKSCVDRFLTDDADDLDLSAGIHAATHLMISIIPMFALCNPTDIETEHKSSLQTRERPAQLIIYDRYDGSSGFGKIVFHNIENILKACLDTIESCTCEKGCPNCVLSSNCCEYNSAVSKNSALLIFRYMN